MLSKLGKYKKAGMELSINAIVILIIAMVVLGIAILFVRGMFGKIGERVGREIAKGEIAVPATPETPLTIDKEILISKAELKKNVEISVYNPLSNDVSDVRLNLSCVNSTGGNVPSNKIIVAVPPFNIPKNTYVGYTAILTMEEDVATLGESFICKIWANTTTTTNWPVPSATTVLKVVS